MSVFLLLLAAYLVGAIPFGYLIARVKGVDLFRAGSGNIGATNVGRVLGKKYGVLVFVLDFLKGAVPVLVSMRLPADSQTGLGSPSTLHVLTGTFAFLGHLFPVYLGFRGGKGVATGAGTVAMLMPGPAAFAILTWLTVTCSSLIVSMGSVAAVLALSAAWLLTSPHPFDPDKAAATLYCLGGTVLVIVKHLANLKRIASGTETRWPNTASLQTMSKAIHLLAIGLWFGSTVFFNFLAAPAMNRSFREAIPAAPTDRTANLPITQGLDKEQIDSLSSALFGTAVGPVFPRFFAVQGVCCTLALVTSLRWWSLGQGHRRRVYVLVFGALLVAASWPISQYVSELRLERFSPDSSIAAAAKGDFVSWHLVSLALSAATALVTMVAMTLAAWLPAHEMSIAQSPSVAPGGLSLSDREKNPHRLRNHP